MTVPLDHLLHLVGHAGHGVDDLAPSPARRSGRRGRARCRAAGPWSSRPTGHVGLAQVVLRHRRGPRDSNRRPDVLLERRGRARARRPSRWAMTSRVMSSWVGPSPPHTMTASARSSAWRNVGDDAVEVVADLGLEQRVDARPSASCSPIHDELVSTICPSSSSVPTATTSQRIGRTLSPARARDRRTGRGDPAALRLVVMTGTVVRPFHGGGGAAPSSTYCARADDGEDTATHSTHVRGPADVGERRQQGEADRELLDDGLDLGDARGRARPGPGGPSRTR